MSRQMARPATWTTPVTINATATVTMVNGVPRLSAIKVNGLECPFDGAQWDPPLTDAEDDDDRIHQALHDDYDLGVTVAYEDDGL